MCTPCCTVICSRPPTIKQVENAIAMETTPSVICFPCLSSVRCSTKCSCPQQKGTRSGAPATHERSLSESKGPSASHKHPAIQLCPSQPALFASHTKTCRMSGKISEPICIMQAWIPMSLCWLSTSRIQKRLRQLLHTHSHMRLSQNQSPRSSTQKNRQTEYLLPPIVFSGVCLNPANGRLRLIGRPSLLVQEICVR